MVVRMRHNSSQTRQRRSHHALALGPATKCADCGAARPTHQACPACGRYRGRLVLDLAGRRGKKAEKKKKQNAAAGK